MINKLIQSSNGDRFYHPIDQSMQGLPSLLSMLGTHDIHHKSSPMFRRSLERPVLDDLTEKVLKAIDNEGLEIENDPSDLCTYYV